MKAPEIYQVTLWRKTGERSAMGSGEPQIFFAWTAAARFARKWMKNGPDFYAAIGHYEPPFSDRREGWRGHVERMARYWGTASYSERAQPEGGLREGFDCGALDAPSFVPGGASLWRESAGGFVGSVVTLRAGYWR